MPEPSWRQLATIPETVEKRSILRALAITPPPNGISDTCVFSGCLSFRQSEAGLIIEDNSGTYFSDAKTALRQHHLSKGTPSGDLARWWLTAKGYLPPSQ